MAGFMGRESPDLKAELAKAGEPEMTPEAFDGGDGLAGDPGTDVTKVTENQVTQVNQPTAKIAEPDEELDTVADEKGKPIPPDEARKMALRRERQRARELETQLAQERETKARMEERWNVLQQLSQQQPQQAQQNDDPEPDVNLDPLGNALWQNRQLQKEVQAVKEWQAQQAQTQQRASQVGQTRAAFAQKAQAYAQKAPDWMDAYNHVTNARYQDALFAGYPPQLAQQLVLQEEANMVAQWLQSGADPADKVYEYAKQRGYQPRGGAAPASANVPAVQAPAAQQAAGAEVIQLQQQRAQAAHSLSDAGGKPTNNGLTLEELARLPPDEFAKMTQGGAWGSLLGGKANKMFGRR